MSKNNNFIGVGGLLYHNNRYLLVRHSYGEYKGLWIIPGGHVQPGEHIDAAIKREFLEETNISAEATEIIAIRSRQREAEVLDCYIIFQLKYLSGEAKSDNYENEAVGYFTYEDLEAMENVVPLSKIVVQKHHLGELKKMQLTEALPPYTSANYSLKLFI